MSAPLASIDVSKAGVILACERSVGRHTVSITQIGRGHARGEKERNRYGRSHFLCTLKLACTAHQQRAVQLPSLNVTASTL